jgi:FkbM family methyltransferase
MYIWRLVYPYLLKVLNRAKRRRVTANLRGITWALDMNNSLDVHLKKNDGVYHRIMPMLFKALDQKSIVIDVGANRGYWTLPLAQYFLFCYSIEADADNFQKLNENIALNRSLADQILSLNVAASDYDGDAKLNIRRSIDGDANLNTGLSSLVVGEANSFSREVKAIRIDSIFKLEPANVSLIKVDVEGAEFEVLSGSTQLIQQSLPCIFWEANFTLDVQFNRENVLRSWDLLNNFGYKHYVVFEAGEISECVSMIDLASIGFDVDVLSVHTSNVEKFFLGAKFRHRDNFVTSSKDN